VIPAQNMALVVPASGHNGSAPHCEHLDGFTSVTPQSSHCRACPDSADPGTPLVACMTCGWVACSDDAPNRHARAHYEETDHPLACSLQLGSQWKWCYVHERQV
jgi:uncharacterized UBP type Zn finger protein